MLQQLLQQHETLQRYLSTLFDSLPTLAISSSSTSTSSLQPNDIIQILQQNVQYGRKIIQLSDKFTAKYRKDHFVDRKDFQDKILTIYRSLYGDVGGYGIGVEEMLIAVVRKLEDSSHALQVANGGISRSSYTPNNYLNPNSKASSVNAHNFGTRDSKIEYYRDEAQLSEPQRLGYVHSSKQLQGMMRKSKLSAQNMPQWQQTEHQKRKRSSTNKPRQQKKPQQSQFTTKTVLQIKTFFQQQQLSIRKLFEKLIKLTQTKSNKQSNMNIKISSENSQYTKIINQSDKDNIKDYVHANIQNNIFNIQKIADFIDLLDDCYNKRAKVEGVVQAKFGIYVDQINRREEVFSFAVSRMLENLANLKNQLHKGASSMSQRSQMLSNQTDNNAVSLQIINNLQEIGQNFYDLYPSHNLLKDLKISQNSQHPNQFCFPYTSKQLQKIGYKHEGVQVSLGQINGKSQKAFQREIAQSKKNQLQLFKAQVRINEHIQKFDRSTKHKKTMQQKQVQKLIQSIKQSFPKKNSLLTTIPTEVQNYQEEFKKIIQNNQKNQKELAEDYQRKVKKYQKNIADLQKAIEELVEENKKEIQKMEGVNRKLGKKLESEKEEVKKVTGLKNSLQKNIKQMSVQISRLQRQIKDLHTKLQQSQTHLLTQNKALQSQLSTLQSQISTLQQSLSSTSSKFEQQREIYHQKIIFLETQQQHKNEQITQLHEELQEMIKQNTILKKQIEQLTQVYQDKIKQLEELIQNIKELQQEVNGKNLDNVELREKCRIYGEKCVGLEKEVSGLERERVRLEGKIKDKQAQADKYKQLGILNQSDINILKQQIQKVKQAYIQSQQHLQQLKQYTHRLQSQKQFLQRENRNYKKEVQSYSNKTETQQLNNEKIEKELRQYYDELNIKKKQLIHAHQEIDQYKRQIGRLRKEVGEFRDICNKADGELRMLRQELSKKVEIDSIETGKRKLELQATKVELRRKTQQLQKMKQSYEQKIEVLDSKNKQLTQFITHKQLLAKITNSHLSQ